MVDSSAPVVDKQAAEAPATDTASQRASSAGRGRATPTAAAPGARQRDARSRAQLERELSGVGKRRWVRRLIVVGVIVALIGGVIAWRARTRPPPPPRYVTAEVTTGDVSETVQSTGQIKPVTEVQVGAQVSGRITKVLVDFNSVVKAGDVLAEIDPTLIGTQVDSNRAQLEAAKASVVRAEAALTTSKQRLDRAKKMVAEGVGTQADLDSAQGAYDVALADVAAAKAQVAQIGAALRSSRTNMEFTRIYSPINGIVINRAVEPGQTVAASFQTPTLFVIAQDLREMRVYADIDEADVGRVKEGMTADVSVDAFPGETFKGTVSQVRFSPFTQSGVVTYAALVDVENPDIKLRPGMTATVTIRSAESKGVKRLPNAALRFKPSPEKDKDGKEIKTAPLPPLPPRKGRVWVLQDATPGAEKIEPREIDIGITDGINTVLLTDLGDAKVVTDEADDPTKGGRRGPRLF